MKSLSRRFLIGVGLTSLAVTILGALAGFIAFQQELSRRQVDYLAQYVRERGANVDRRFSNLTALHKAAEVELGRRMENLSPQHAEMLADTFFPSAPDGTRRSRDAYFDGVRDPDGDYIYGMGAFLARADGIPDEEMRALVAAFRLVSAFGPAARHDYDNFYFFTPGTRLVMFGPDRPDRLMFYRRTAPPTLDIGKEEMARITLPTQDPRRVTRCTNLQRLLQDAKGERLATACITPAYVKGVYVGSFGSSIDLSGFLQEAVKTSLPGATSLMVTGKGELISYPGIEVPGRASTTEVAAYEQRLGLRRLVASIERSGKADGVIASPDSKDIVAFARLSGPDWYLMMSYPRAALNLSAALSASWLLLTGGLAAVAQTLLVVMVARRTIVSPIERLAASCEPQRAGDEHRADMGDIEGRNDEIGILATALRTEREKVDDVLASLEQRVLSRTAELERANTEKSRFLANMSHELRTPLNGVVAVSETLAREQTNPRWRELAELIASSGRLLERVLTDILDFSKIEAGQIQLSRDEFNLQTLVSRIAELHRAAADAKGLGFGWSIAPAADGDYAGDSVRITQVLSNLLSNAVKFTDQGEVVLTVDKTEAGVRFSIVDTGIGFDDEVKARLFARFEQADASIRRRFGGTGLGLAISRSLVELMGGKIDVTSTPGKGACFVVTLPLDAVAAGAEADAEEEGGEFDLAGMRVLLAEDHPTNQKVVQLILQSQGVEVVVADNGAIALERLKQEVFDVVLMDMQMPEMDGLTATSAFREFEDLEGRARTPVVMLTANALDEHVRMSLAAGADRHLSKPIRAESLIQAMFDAMLNAESKSRPQGASQSL